MMDEGLHEEPVHPLHRRQEQCQHRTAPLCNEAKPDFNELNKELYPQVLPRNRNELQACKDGYIYIHDQSARLDTMNCCLSDVGNVLKGGFDGKCLVQRAEDT